MSPEYVATVVFSGLLIVFVALLLLIIAVSLMGKIFALIESRKKSGIVKGPEPGQIPVRSAPPADVKAPETAAVSVSDDDEVIAVIAAAVAQIAAESGKQLRIRSVKRVGNAPRRSAWSNAAAFDSMRSV